MRRVTSRLRPLLLASALALASSCAGKPPPQVSLRPPADLLERPDEPVMPAAALDDEEAYERARDAKIEWGREVAAILDAACRSLRTSGVETLRCREVPE